AVQSMTNTRTTDVAATVNQIKALERVGADIVRVSVPTMDAAEAFKLIKQQVNVPLVADIHFAVQSMTNTRTTDVAATVNQIKALERVGADIVRV
ncbi:flavodoxin-dependent (E)-4-hydroxy-3-methylbut-2-enyl-diphosphate synthase, partial [Enterobacter hormaechei]|uniref:flavodoxin-dependent (E)-4-hydroxy-3-methylbut-2-enyl-diphosphate synthase n=1 Tax=Enterobacter hormaechei TaxID=158836 RepID=UPI0013FDB70C